MPLDPKIPHSDVTYDTIGAAMRVHSRLGPGLKEKHYQRDMLAELRKSGRTVEEEYFVELWDGPQKFSRDGNRKWVVFFGGLRAPDRCR